MADNTLRFERTGNSGASDPLELFHSERSLDLFPSEAEQGLHSGVIVSTPDEPRLAVSSTRSSPAQPAIKSVLPAGRKSWLGRLIVLPSLAAAAWLGFAAASDGSLTEGFRNEATAQVAARHDVYLQPELPVPPGLSETQGTFEKAASAETLPEPSAASPTGPVAPTKTRVKPHPRPAPAPANSTSSTAPSIFHDSGGAVADAVRSAAPSVGHSSIERFKFLGSIALESQPAGAQVFVDGEPVGITPLSRWDLPAGSHVIRVECDGYTRWSAAVQIVTAKTLSLVANLQPARQD